MKTVVPRIAAEPVPAREGSREKRKTAGAALLRLRQKSPYV
jgi:hypothetical protein